MSRFIRKHPYQKVPAIPPFLRNHLWQPLKALLASLELWLLIPITLHSRTVSAPCSQWRTAPGQTE